MNEYWDDVLYDHDAYNPDEPIDVRQKERISDLVEAILLKDHS